MKIVINDCYGGFGLSTEAFSEIYKLKGTPLYFYKLDYETGIHSKLSADEISKSLWVPTALSKDFGDSFSELTDEINKHWVSPYDIERNDPHLVEVVERLGEKANGECAKLKIVKIPDDVEFLIQEYDGIEWIAENHRTWG